MPSIDPMPCGQRNTFIQRLPRSTSKFIIYFVKKRHHNEQRCNRIT